MKKFQLKFFICAFSTVFFFFFQDKLQAEQELKIGVIAPISGHMAAWGVAIANGIKLAEEDYPELRQLKFIFEDDRYDAKLAVSAYQKLRQIDRINLLISFGSNSGHSIAPLAEAHKLPYINLGYEATFVKGKKYVIRSLPPADKYTKALVLYSRNFKPEVKNFQLLITDLPFINSMVEAMKNALSKEENISIIDTVLPNDNDFRATISKLKKQKSEYIGLFLLPDQILAFLKQARELNYKFNFFGTDIIESALKIAPHPELFEAAIYPDNKVDRFFAQRYQEKFNNKDQLSFAANAYDLATILGEELKQKKINAVNILEILKKSQANSGVLGDRNFITDATYGGYFDYPACVKSINKAKPEISYCP